MATTNTQIGYIDNLLTTGIINPEEYLKRLDTSYRMKPNLFSEEDLDYIEKQHKKYDIKWNRDLDKSGSNILSVVNQFTSGVVEGFTTLGWAEEADTTSERIANQFGHLLGFAPDIIASVISGGRWIPIAQAKQAARQSSKAVREGISKVASKAPPLLRKEISPNTFALQSVPMMVADKVLEQTQSAIGSTALLSKGFLTKGLFGKASVRNAATQAVHLGVALGVSSWKEGPKAMLDATMHGAAAGAVFGSIGNYVRIGDMLRNKDTVQMGREAVKLASRQLYQDPNKYEAVEMLIKGTLGASFQGGMTTLRGAPLPDQIYEYLLGFFFGASAKSAGFMNRTKFINDRYFPSNENITTVKEKWRKDPEYQSLPKVDRDYIDSYLDSVRVQQLNVINSQKPSFMQQVSQTVKDIAAERNIDLTKPISVEDKIIIDRAEHIKEKVKTPKKISVKKEGVNVQAPEIGEGKQETVKKIYNKNAGIETKSTIVESIFSGMQSGADYGGLKSAKRKGIKTGGFVTSDFKTKITGSKKAKDKLVKDYGVERVTEPITRRTERGDREFAPEDYANRTIRNIENTDATVIFARPEHIDKSAGTNRTIGYASEGIWKNGSSSQTLSSGRFMAGFKPHIIITKGLTSKKRADAEAKQLRQFIEDVTKKIGKKPTLNIAGHGNDRVPGNKTWKNYEDYVDYVVDKSLEGTVQKPVFDANVDNPNEVVASIPKQPKNTKDFAQERLGDYKNEISMANENIEAVSSEQSSKTILKRPLETAINYLLNNDSKLDYTKVKLDLNNIAEKAKTDIEFFQKIEKYGITLPTNIRQELGRGLLIKKNLEEQTDHGIQDLNPFKGGYTSKEGFGKQKFPSEDIDGTILVKYRSENKHDKHVKGTIEDVSYVISDVQYDKRTGTMFSKKQLGIDAPGIYKLQYDKILTHSYRTKLDSRGKAEYEFTLNEKALDAINTKLIKDGFYVSKALKDKGVVLVEPLPIQDKFPNETNYLSRTDQIKILEKIGFKNITETNRQVYMANTYYLLREHTLRGLKGHGKLKVDNILDGIAELRANNNQKLNYKDVVEYNKYAAMDIGTNIPMNAKDHRITDSKQKMGVVYLKDIPGEVHGEIMLGNTDSVHSVRSDVFKSMANRYYIDKTDGKMKLTFFRGPRNGVNLLKNKIGSEIASKALDKWMFDQMQRGFPIHHVIYESGGKTNKGNFNAVELKWDAKKGEYYTDKPLTPKEVVDYNWNETYIDLGVREDSSHFNKGISPGKQLYDSVSMAKIRTEDPTRAENLDREVNEWIRSSNEGDPQLGIELINSFRSGKEITRDFDVFRVPEEVIIEMKNDTTRGGINNPTFKKVLKKIVEANENDLSTAMWEPGQNSAMREAIQENYQISEILNMNNYDPLVFGRHPYKDYINKALFRFIVTRNVKPRDPQGFQAPLMGLNAEELSVHQRRENQGPNKITTGVGENAWMLGRDARSKPVRVEGIPAIKTLGQAWDMLRLTKLTKTEAINIKNVLNEQTLLRVPNSGVSGARVPEFGGFVDKPGIGIYVNAKEKFYMDGADNDFDEAFVHYNIPKELNKEFRNNRDYLRDEKGNLINLETPPKFLTDLGYFVEYAPKTSNDVLKDIIDPYKRIEAGRSAFIGKEAMGGAVNALDRQIKVMDAIINTKITEPSREVPYMLVEVNTNKNYDGIKKHRIVLKDGEGNIMNSTNIQDYLKLLKQFEVESLKAKNGYADSPKYLNVPDNFTLSELTWSRYFQLQVQNEKGVFENVSKLSEISWGDATSSRRTKPVTREKKTKYIDITKIRELENLAETYHLLYGQPTIAEINNSPRVINEFVNNADFRYDLQTYNVAQKLSSRMDWGIQSFDYIKSISRGFDHLNTNAIEPYDFVLQMTTELNTRLLNSKYYDKYGLIPGYRNEIDAIYSLKRPGNHLFKELKAIGDKKYNTLALTPTRNIEQHFHNALDLNVADYVSDVFITKVGKSRMTELSVDEAFTLVKDIQSQVNSIKESFYYSANVFRDRSGFNVERGKLDYKWVNQELLKIRARYRKVPAYKPFIKDIDLIIDSYLSANPRFRFKEMKNKTTEQLFKIISDANRFIEGTTKNLNKDQVVEVSYKDYDTNKMGATQNPELMQRWIRKREQAEAILYNRVPFFDRSKVVTPENRQALLDLKKGIIEQGLEAMNKKMRVPKKTQAYIEALTESFSGDQILDINTMNQPKIVRKKAKEVEADIQKQKVKIKVINDSSGKKIGETIISDVDGLFGVKTSKRQIANETRKDLAKKFKESKRDPNTEKEQAVKTIKRVFKDQHKYLERLDKNILEPTTPENEIVLKEFRKILEEYPQVLPNLDYYFAAFTKKGEGVMRDISTMDSKDMVNFIGQLKRSFTPMKDLITKDGKFKEKPRGRDHMYFYDIVGDRLGFMSELELQPILENKMMANGEIKAEYMKQPMSPLHLMKNHVDFTDTITKAARDNIEKVHAGWFKYLTKDDATLQEHRKLLEEHAVNSLEWNNGKYPAGEKIDYESKNYIKTKYNESKALIQKLDESGARIEFKGKNVKPSVFVSQQLKKDIKTFTDWVYDNYIASRHKNIKETFLHIGTWNKDFKLWKPGQEFKRLKTDKTFGREFEMMKLEEIFLDKDTGIFREDRYKAFFDSIMNYQGAYTTREGGLKRSSIEGQFNNREISQFLMPSYNDMLFFKHHLKLRDEMQGIYKNYDLSKPEKLPTKIKKELKQRVINRLNKNSSYKELFQNKVTEGYFPRVGHTDISKNAQKIERELTRKVNAEMETITDKSQLPEHIANRMLITDLERGRPLNFTEAKQLYRAEKLSLQNREFMNSALEGQMANEITVNDLLSRDKLSDSRYIGDYTYRNMHKRGPYVMPFYRLDVEALRRYAGGLVKSHLTNTTGINLELIVKRFDKVNNVENDINALGWSGYLRDAGLNMMGLSLHRSLQTHGIQEKHIPLYQRFIDNKFSTKGLNLLKAELDLVYDFREAVELSPQKKTNILLSNRGNVTKANAEYIKQINRNAKRLLSQINTTGKYGSLYHMTSDDAVGRKMETINDAFGAKLFGELSSDPAQKRTQVNEGLRYLSNLEGKYELISLLSAPKTPITNFIGGYTNLITDVGLNPVRKSFNTEWMLNNIFREYNKDTGQMETAKYEFFNADTKKIEQKTMTTREDIFNWMDGSVGVFDTTQLQLVAIEKVFGRKNAFKVVKEFGERLMDARNSGYDMVTKTSRDRLRDATMMDLIREYKVDESIVDMGAFFMRESERHLRGTTFLSHMIFHLQNTLNTPDGFSSKMSFNNPGLIKLSLEGVKASQFLYQATERPNFANTSLGRVLTRFQPYAWNSIRRRMDIYRNAKDVGFDYTKIASKRFQRQVSFDLFALAMANIFVASIFEYSLSPPMSWMQDTAQLMFGDTEERDRAFFNQYPSKVLAPLQIVTPPVARFILPPITSILNGDYENFYKFQLATYFPFGRLGRDLYRTYQSPAMAVDFMTGIPLHRIHSLRRDQIEAQTELDEIEANLEAEDV